MSRGPSLSIFCRRVGTSPPPGTGGLGGSGSPSLSLTVDLVTGLWPLLGEQLTEQTQNSPGVPAGCRNSPHAKLRQAPGAQTRSPL